MANTIPEWVIKKETKQKKIVSFALTKLKTKQQQKTQNNVDIICLETLW